MLLGFRPGYPEPLILTIGHISDMVIAAGLCAITSWFTSGLPALMLDLRLHETSHSSTLMDAQIDDFII